MRCVVYAYLWLGSFILGAAIKPFMRNVVMLNVIMLSVMAPFIFATLLKNKSSFIQIKFFFVKIDLSAIMNFNTLTVVPSYS
jgi:hypothetical protein